MPVFTLPQKVLSAPEEVSCHVKDRGKSARQDVQMSVSKAKSSLRQQIHSLLKNKEAMLLPHSLIDLFI